MPSFADTDAFSRVQSGDRLAEYVISQFKLSADPHREAIVVTYVALQMLQATYPKQTILDEIVEEAQTLVTTFAHTAGHS